LGFGWAGVDAGVVRSGVVVGVNAGLLLLRLAVVACGRYMLDVFFITVSHCAWRHVISFSTGEKETKQRKRLSTIAPLNHRQVSVPSVQASVFGT
jgi:hypothetical protein